MNCSCPAKDALTSSRSEQQGMSPKNSPSTRSFILLIVAPSVGENVQPDTTPIPAMVVAVELRLSPGGFSRLNWISVDATHVFVSSHVSPEPPPPSFPPDGSPTFSD